MYSSVTPRKIIRYKRMRRLGLSVKPITYVSPSEDDSRFLEESRSIFEQYRAIMLRTDSASPILNLPKDLGPDYNGIWDFNDFLTRYRALHESHPNLYVLAEAFFLGGDSININIITGNEPRVEVTEGIPMPKIVRGEITPLTLRFRGWWRIETSDRLVPPDVRLDRYGDRSQSVEWLKQFGLTRSTLFRALDTAKPYITEGTYEWWLMERLGEGKPLAAETIIYKPTNEHLFFDYTLVRGNYSTTR
ncbi:MAG: hypothetical protein ACTSWZ_05765 [Candidatus Heimdallarchaeaceae archaeon]